MRWTKGQRWTNNQTGPHNWGTPGDLGYDLIWFGIYLVIVTELSYITPPVGLNAFVLKSVVKDVQLSTIFKGLFPFLFVDILRVIIVLAFPGLVLLIPNLM